MEETENEAGIKETIGFVRNIVKAFIYSQFILIIIIIIFMYLPRAFLELGL